GPFGEWRSLGHTARRAVRDEYARHFETSEGARASASDWPRTRSPMAALPPGSSAAQGRRRVDRPLPPVLGAELRSPGRLSARIESPRRRGPKTKNKGQKTCPQATQELAPPLTRWNA